MPTAREPRSDVEYLLPATTKNIGVGLDIVVEKLEGRSDGGVWQSILHVVA